MEYNKTKIRVLLSIAAIFFLTAAVLAGSRLSTTEQNIIKQAAPATILSIAPQSQSAQSDDTIGFTVMMDTGQNHVTGIDLVLKFDPSVMFITGLSLGADITNLNNAIKNNFDNSTGVISYSTFTLNRNQAVSGDSLETLVINAKIKQNPRVGNYLLSFDPATAVSATNETTNVLDTTINGVLSIRAKPTASPAPTASPSPVAGEPNSCGGTCGSNNNCKTTLICVNGFCRNPSCTLSTDCICYAATSTPTTRPTRAPVRTTTPTSRPTATTTAIVITPTLTPTTTPSSQTDDNFWEEIYRENVQDVDSTPISEPAQSGGWFSDSNILPWIIGSLVVAGVTLILIVLGIYRQQQLNQNKPPVIKI